MNGFAFATWVSRIPEARALLDRLVALANDVGLLAEEYDADQRRMAGNVPQAFSHLALVHAVRVLERVEADGNRTIPEPVSPEV